jgi:hypothetical protein
VREQVAGHAAAGDADVQRQPSPPQWQIRGSSVLRNCAVVKDAPQLASPIAFQGTTAGTRQLFQTMLATPAA